MDLYNYNTNDASGANLLDEISAKDILKAFPTEGVESDDFKELYKSYMEGHISSKILWDYLQNFR